MRGGFVACFGGGPSSTAILEELAPHLRWHTGSPVSYPDGPLSVVALEDPQQGPRYSANGNALLVHGEDVASFDDLQAAGRRFAAIECNEHICRASRDPMGQAPLFFRIARGAAWLASEIHPLVALAPTKPDLEALAAEAAFVPYTMRTGWEGILRVPPGSTVAIDKTLDFSVSAHWRPDKLLAKRRCDYDDAVREFRQRFDVAVSRCLDRSTGVLLSGGLDSAAVAVAAGQDGGRPRLLSVSFPEFPDTDETHFARATADAAGNQLTILRGRTDPWDPQAESAIFGTTSTLLPTGVFEVAMTEFANDGVGTVLDGHDGDGALGLYPGLYGLLLAHLQGRRLARLARQLGLRTVALPAIRESVRPSIRRLLSRGGTAPLVDQLENRLLPYFTGSIAERMADELRWRPPRQDWKRYQLLPLTPPVTLVLEQMETDAARFGVDLMHPFADRDLLSFLVSLPFSVKVDPRRSKPLLRDGLADLLPDSVRNRLDKVNFNSVLERRVDSARCLRWIRESGVRLPNLDYPALYEVAERDPASLTLVGWIRLARAHVFAAAA